MRKKKENVFRHLDEWRFVWLQHTTTLLMTKSVQPSISFFSHRFSRAAASARGAFCTSFSPSIHPLASIYISLPGSVFGVGVTMYKMRKREKERKIFLSTAILVCFSCKKNDDDWERFIEKSLLYRKLFSLLPPLFHFKKQLPPFFPKFFIKGIKNRSCFLCKVSNDSNVDFFIFYLFGLH